MKTCYAMILAAGLGQRLKPITKTIPKPLLKINHKALLGYTIDMLLAIGINKIVINIHYKSELLKKYLDKNYNKIKIKLVYEPVLLDTGGGVKNAIKYFSGKSILILNSDILWHRSTYTDIKNLINSHNVNNYECSVLLSTLINSYGFEKKQGDFIINNNLLFRNNLENKGLIYSGAQVINISILKLFRKKTFSFNLIWDYLIKREKISGIIMKSKWLHFGNYKLLKNMKNISLD